MMLPLQDQFVGDGHSRLSVVSAFSVMAGLNRSKNDAASPAYVLAIHVFEHNPKKDVDARGTRPGMTSLYCQRL